MRFIADTNVLRSARSVAVLSSRCRQNGHELVIPALVWCEFVFQGRRKHGADFDISLFHTFLKAHQIAVESTAQEHAEFGAAVLARAFPDNESWNVAKRQALGLDAAAARASALFDFYVAPPHVAPNGSTVVVTDDTGRDISAAVRAVPINEALRLAEAAAP